MSFRTIFCSSCGLDWRVAISLPAETPVACGSCGNIFPVPRFAPETTEGTPARVYAYEELPAELQAEMATATDLPAAQADASEATTRPSVPIIDMEAAARRAYDLDDSGAPKRRTGAKLIRAMVLEDRATDGTSPY